uniref:Uncharacterized protein n=1 Tax=Haemonchus contortus TaxID=6289 RepID=A0A7I4YEQ1_HAECO
MKVLLFTLLAAVSVIRAHGPLEDIRDEVIKTLQETPETKKSLEERIKEEPKIDFVQVRPIGDDINEINENWQIDGNLFQGDLALTPMKLLLFTMLAAVSAIRAHEPLEDIKEEVIITLQESPETKKSLEERIKEEPKIDFVQVKPIGDDINEINENWQIDGNLFQGDLALTPDEEKSLVKDVEQEVAEMMKSSTEAAH